MLEALASGLQLGVSFNPLYSLVGATIAAMLLARSPGPMRWTLALLVICVGWLLGDGIGLVVYAQELVAGSAGLSAAEWVEALVWALVGLGLGYVLPVWAGVFVGRRVTWGTGWLSAGATAAMVSGMISALAARLGG